MNRKVIILLLVVIAFIAGAVYFYNGYLYKDARDITSEEAAHSLTAQQLFADYENNMAKADSMYLNKTIVIQGTVTQLTDSLVIVDAVAVCAFSTIPEIKTGDKISVKGRCIGFDELFGEVKLDQCSRND